MRSKTSKRRRNSHSPWKAALGCSEQALRALAAELAAELRLGDRVLLEGPLGAGKSTFARALMEGLSVSQPAEGSPTFALAHEYDSRVGALIHVDFYRLKSEGEIEDAGITSYFWERDAVVVTEWLSMWPIFESAVLERGRPGRRWRVTLSFSKKSESARDVVIERVS